LDTIRRYGRRFVAALSYGRADRREYCQVRLLSCFSTVPLSVSVRGFSAALPVWGMMGCRVAQNGPSDIRSNSVL